MQQSLPKQNSLLWSYFKVSKWLLFALFLFILESYLYGIQLKYALLSENKWQILFWLSFFLFSFIHIFLVLMDSWSRFQNYKRIKDQLYYYGFQPKVANNYLVSKCQRHALKIACKELRYQKEHKRFLKLRSVKWYHFIPYFMIEDPLFIMKSHFWNRTFLEKYYAPKFNYIHIYKKRAALHNPIYSSSIH
ncbi:hypothetical protein SAMN04488096_109144 [Mesonia phycicola]|uniref:Uncharacterized protein n=1 Tax=Mesonia phycicola TaxID=579105 RepID=A0A1M6H602_9FLAO|nr:hypothetical protein [Mesonia phycicola]SHJ17601.1 hypothetical protein SAMN04488096_109144 [Mesonia phycicola]